MIVTAALATVAAAAVPRLRGPLFVYVAAVARHPRLFGAHFPLDVLVGTALGCEIGPARRRDRRELRTAARRARESLAEPRARRSRWTEPAPAYTGVRR